MHGLIIKSPYIDHILEGKKTWEMRSTATQIRGRIALIRKGSGHVVGVANLVDVHGPLSEDELLRNSEKHLIPDAIVQSGEAAKWDTAWVLRDVEVLDNPVPYRHRSGAVIWVVLDDCVVARIHDQLAAGAFIC